MKNTFLALAAAFLIATGASAADFTTPLRDPDGKPITMCAPDHPNCGKDFTIADAAIFALNQPYTREEENLPISEKLLRGELIDRIKADRHAVLSASETALLEKLLARYLVPHALRQAVKVLDPAELEKK